MLDPFRYKWWALIGLSLLAFTAFLDIAIVATALPFIQTALGARIIELQWVANIFPIVLSMTMIAVGKFGDLWGRKKIFFIGIFIFGLAALGAGFSNRLGVLIFFRGLQAIGASIVFINAAALLSDVFPEKERSKAISIYGGVTGLGLVMGPFLGGILVGLLGWRWVFWINIPIIVIGLAACSFSLKTGNTKHAVTIDWRGLALLVFGLGALTYGVVSGAEQNWTSLLSWILLILGMLSLTFLIALELKLKSGLLNLHIFHKPLIVLATISAATAGVVSTVFMFFDPLYLRNVRALSPYHIGILIAVIPAAQAINAFFYNRTLKWLGITNLLFYAVVAGLLAVTLHRFIFVETPLLFLIFPFFLLGVSWGVANAGLITAVNQVVASHEIGSALGTIATIWNIVGSMVLAISTVIFHHVELTSSSFLPAFHRAVDFNIAFCALLFLFAFFTRAKMRKMTYGN